MATDASVMRAIRTMEAAGEKRFYSQEDLATAIVTFAEHLEPFGDDAVEAAGVEWAHTMGRFPKLVEFLELVRKHDERLVDARALPVGGMMPEQRFPVGKPGMESVGAAIVIERMLDAVAREAPLGWLGRARGLSDTNGRVIGSVRELGHTHMDGGGPCARCQALATIAFEQVVEFEDSTVTWDAWESQATGLDGLRKCANASCDGGWVTRVELGGVERVAKCETCGGPKAPRAKPKPEGEGDRPTIVRRRRRY